MQSYVFYDVDNKEVDVEDSLNYLSNRLETLRILWDYGMVKGFSNAVLSSIDEYIESIFEVSFELCSSAHLAVLSKCDRGTHAWHGYPVTW